MSKNPQTRGPNPSVNALIAQPRQQVQLMSQLQPISILVFLENSLQDLGLPPSSDLFGMLGGVLIEALRFRGPCAALAFGLHEALRFRGPCAALAFGLQGLFPAR